VCPPDTSSTTKRELEARVLEERRVQVGLEVVHPDEGHVPGERQRLRRRDPHQQGTDEPGPVRARHRVDAGPSSTPASTIALAMTGLSASTCARDAISGTTPPKSAWISTWLDTTLEMTSLPPITSAAAVSSQLVSMPEHERRLVDRDPAAHRRPAKRVAYSSLSMSWHHITIASSLFS
jgi:hypothetical protein